MIHRHHTAQEWLTLRQELLISGPMEQMHRADINALVHIADMARECKRLPPAARRVVMSAALEFATDEEATAVYPPPPTTTTETEPTPERHPWIERIARVTKSTGIPLDPAAIDDATTLDIGVIPVADAFRLALAGLATNLGSFTRDGRRRWRIEIRNADDGEPVTATVLT